MLDVDTQEQCLPQRPHRPGNSESLTGHIIEDRIPYHPTSQYTSTTPFLISYQHHYNNALPGSDSSKQDAKQQTLIISISSLFPANSVDGLVSDQPPGFNLAPHGPFFLSYPVWSTKFKVLVPLYKPDLYYHLFQIFTSSTDSFTQIVAIHEVVLMTGGPMNFEHLPLRQTT